MGDIGEYWRDAKAYQKKRQEEWDESPAGKRFYAKMRKQKRQCHHRVQVFVELHGFEYSEFNGGSQRRVKNLETGKFVDWWDTGTIRCADGSYNYFGDTVGNTLLQELHKLCPNT